MLPSRSTRKHTLPSIPDRRGTVSLRRAGLLLCVTAGPLLLQQGCRARARVLDAAFQHRHGSEPSPQHATGWRLRGFCPTADGDFVVGIVDPPAYADTEFVSMCDVRSGNNVLWRRCPTALVWDLTTTSTPSRRYAVHGCLQWARTWPSGVAEQRRLSPFLGADPTGSSGSLGCYDIDTAAGRIVCTNGRVQVWQWDGGGATSRDMKGADWRHRDLGTPNGDDVMCGSPLFLREGRFFLTEGHYFPARVWQTDGSCYHAYVDQDGDFGHLSVSASGRWLAWCGGDLSVFDLSPALVRPRRGRPMPLEPAMIVRVSESITCAVFCPDDERTIVTCSDELDGHLVRWRVSEDRRGISAGVTIGPSHHGSRACERGCLAFSADGRWLLHCSRGLGGAEVRLYDTADWGLKRIITLAPEGTPPTSN